MPCNAASHYWEELLHETRKVFKGKVAVALNWVRTPGFQLVPSKHVRAHAMQSRVRPVEYQSSRYSLELTG